jgi:23S rRNA (uracil1939-C5)-methyltransferase
MKSKSSYGEAVLEEIIERGSERATPPCNLFGNCGGCAWQHIPIEAQHRWKERIVRDSLRSLPNLDQVTFHPLVESPDTWRYRNKMEFTCSTRRWLVSSALFIHG